MSFWESLAFSVTMATMLGVFLTIYGMINNKTLKVESKNTRDIITEFRKEMIGEAKNTKEILERITQLIASEGEKIDRIAQLIVSEGEKTRQTILSHG
ncbi:MAG: hypothetical protein AABZ11_11025 [Nitrospinota bacterium]